MSEGLEIAVHAALIGTGATVVMDLWALFLKRFFGVPSLNYGMIGRWFGHFPRGRFVHDNIAEAAPIRGELIIGRIAHYAIGITFAALLPAIWGLGWARHPTPLPALIVGLVTLVAPFFIMQPGMGAGIAASKTPNPNVARLRSVVTHTVYGIGLYGSAVLSTMLIRP
jgi:Protein of unknown function (DUF2938)